MTDLALERRTTEGPVRGKTSEPGAIAWLGVPFADVAERWALPKPPPARGFRWWRPTIVNPLFKCLVMGDPVRLRDPRIAFTWIFMRLLKLILKKDSR
ncbi:MAG: hypothetical protein Ct9H300mP8_02460 [Gammaproteobacteria bacterium]|nr:MAG: hypothetical protein Ct9H300mP8_02460 [Gammaproteobacteria bacterium]